MSLYTGTTFRTGSFGYTAWAAQAAQLVANYNDQGDPDVAMQAGVTTLLGIAPVPAFEINDNIMPVEGAGYHQDWNEIPRRRECSFRQAVQIQDGTFLANAIRSDTYVGGKDGLPLFTIEQGWTDENPYRIQGVDCLINSLSLNVQETQFVTADLDIWPMAVIRESPTTQTSFPAYTPPEDVLRWEQLSWTSTVTGTSVDLKPCLQNLRFSVSNTLSREGMRKRLTDGATPAVELAISRTPREILPGLEKLQLAYTLYDLPTSLSPANPKDWGTVVLLAQNADASKTLRITIDHHYCTRIGQQQANAGDILTFTADVAAMGVVIAAT